MARELMATCTRAVNVCVGGTTTERSAWPDGGAFPADVPAAAREYARSRTEALDALNVARTLDDEVERRRARYAQYAADDSSDHSGGGGGGSGDGARRSRRAAPYDTRSGGTTTHGSDGRRAAQGRGDSAPRCGGRGARGALSSEPRLRKLCGDGRQVI
jgi:hypothetical protein